MSTTQAIAKSTVVHPSRAEQMKIFRAMPEELQKIATKLDEQHAAEVKSVLLVNWDKGKQIEAVIENSGNRYGENAVEQLAAYLGTSTTALYDLRTYCQVYNRDEVKLIGDRKMENGRRVSLGHLMAIMRIKSGPADRKKLLEMTFEKSLTTNELALEISSKFESRNVRKGGRKPSVPTSPGAGIDQIRTKCAELHNRIKPWTASIFDELDEAEPDRFSPGMLSKMEKADEEIRKTAEGLEAAHARLAKNIERARRVLMQRKSTPPVSKGPKASLPSKKALRSDKVKPKVNA